MNLSRRHFLASTSAVVGVGTVLALDRSAFSRAAGAEPEPTVLRVANRVIEVNGKAANVYGLLQPGGASGLITPAGRFRVHLESQIDASTLIHWHGLLPPYGQDGVPGLPQPPLPSGQSYDYDFPLDTPGTHWMHAHTLQEQRLLAAPLIVTDTAEAAADEQPVVVLFHDFSFKSPEELLADLRGAKGMSGMTDMNGMANMPGMSGDSMSGGMAMDINDIDFDAYLANDRTLDDPAVFRVEAGGLVRLRLINGATATAFWIDLGELDGDAIAVDGNPIAPVGGKRFPLAMGQRIDIRIRLPKAEGVWPILALREGAVERTGFMLATKAGAVRRIAPVGEQRADVLGLDLEENLTAARPFADKPADRREMLSLAGDMAAYAWTLTRQGASPDQPLPVRPGDRVEITMGNRSMMGHPMHLHGHHFQVVGIDGRRMAGAVRDTVWVPPMREVTIAFDANNPGRWAFHCHHLYHMASGMMMTVAYEA